MEPDCDKHATAFHEAGHLVVAHAFGEADYAELLDNEENCGYTKYKSELAEMEQRICILILLSGPITELRFGTSRNEEKTIEDVESNDIYRAMVALGWNPAFDSDEEYVNKLRPFHEEAEQLVCHHWKTIKAVASLLLQTGKASVTDVEQLV